MDILSEGLEDLDDPEKKRPFCWYDGNEPVPKLPEVTVMGMNIQEQVADLEIAILFYLKNRGTCYINHLAKGKSLFNIFFTSKDARKLLLKEPLPLWHQGFTDYLKEAHSSSYYWNPGFELQRLHLHTGIHWSYLEVAWTKVQSRLIQAGDVECLLYRTPKTEETVRKFQTFQEWIKPQ